MRWWAAALLLGGCLGTEAVRCEDGRLCPPGTACDDLHARCVLPDQLESCRDRADGESCEVGTAPGLCTDEICLERGCGDLQLGGSEQCDGPRFPDGIESCDDLGYYDDGPIACLDDCSIDVSACRRSCGDGVVDDGEEDCDYLVAGSAGSCVDRGFYDEGAAGCTTACTYDVSDCTGECGDGTVNGPELCEPGAPPSYLSCLDYGFQSGQLACTAMCAAGFDDCHHAGLWPIGSELPVYFGVWVHDETHAIAVGLQGHAMELVGSAWSEIDVGTPENLRAVDGTGLDDIFAVGMEGTIIHRSAAGWAPQTSGTTEDFWDAWVTASDDVLAVGDAGTIVRYDGSSWSPMTSGTSAQLRNVWAAGPDEAWAVGAGGTILHFDGTTWSPEVSGVSVQLEAVWGSGADDVFAVGGNGTILHRAAGAWSPMTSGTSKSLRAIWGTAPDAVLATGFDGAMLVYDGATWTALDAPSGHLMALDGQGPDLAIVLESTGLVYRWEGFGRAPDQAPTTINGLWGASATDLSAAANTAIWHFDGTSWSEESSGWSQGVTAIWGVAGHRFAGGGDGIVIHDDGGGWAAEPTPVTEGEISALGGTSPTDVYAVALGGEILHRDADDWTVVHTATTELYDVWAAASDDVYAVGALGTVLHFDGSAWAPLDVGTLLRSVNAVWGSSPSDVHLAGANGLLLHFDGTAWSDRSFPTTRSLYALHGSAPDDVFAVGDHLALHFDGSVWTPVDLGGDTFSTSLWTDAHHTFVPNGGVPSTVRHLVRACACL